jgi:hypothetical protein
MSLTQNLLDQLSPNTITEYHERHDAYTVAAGKLYVHMVSETRVINISRQIDTVLTSKIVKLEGTNTFIVFVFGNKTMQTVAVQPGKDARPYEDLRFDFELSCV